MVLMRRTGPHSRWELRVGRGGVSATYLRPKVGGGWYVRDSITVPWPWRDVS